ncbi:MAG: response regulator [Chthoniobacteraceae bacterium]
MKILSVDDKDENLYMLEALLRGHGHEVDSASNGLDALRLAERGRYDLIVSDILMPRMDGFQLCRELQKDDRLRRIPLIFYTATYTDPKDAAFALSLGAARFLTKPLEPEKFIDAINEVAASARSTVPEPEAPVAPLEEESIYLKEYNARLIAKLEKKMLDLEVANKALQEDIDEREKAHRERERLEAQLRRAQKMEAIGTLAGGIAHDFNNILAGIIGFAEFGLQESGNPEATAQNFREILHASNRARELVNQILTFSRHRDQPRAPLQLGKTVEDALRILRASIPTMVSLSFVGEPDVPAVLADATHVHQLVSNLVTNAWHAIGDQPGRITLKLAKFDVDADFSHTHPDLRPGRYVRLSISDSGQGMSPEVAERIFEPFFTTKESCKGTGLGLSVVHGIMQTYDGAITVYSEPGSGTVFHLYFPALENEPWEAGGGVSAIPRGHGERVLLIEDEPVLAALGERFLRRLGYLPVAATDPAQALARFRQEHYDLVITDLTMPLMSGVEVARRIWQIRNDTPIILTTGYSASLDLAKTIDLGFRDLLLKPYHIQALGESLQRTLAARRH